MRRRLTSAGHCVQPGRYIARNPPWLEGEVEGLDAEFRPEPGSTDVMLTAVTAIVPNRGRAAQRQQVPSGYCGSKPGKHADIGAF